MSRIYGMYTDREYSDYVDFRDYLDSLNERYEDFIDELAYAVHFGTLAVEIFCGQHDIDIEMLRNWYRVQTNDEPDF